MQSSPFEAGETITQGIWPRFEHIVFLIDCHPYRLIVTDIIFLYRCWSVACHSLINWVIQLNNMAVEDGVRLADRKREIDSGREGKEGRKRRKHQGTGRERETPTRESCVRCYLWQGATVVVIVLLQLGLYPTHVINQGPASQWCDPGQVDDNPP